MQNDIISADERAGKICIASFREGLFEVHVGTGKFYIVMMCFVEEPVFLNWRPLWVQFSFPNNLVWHHIALCKQLHKTKMSTIVHMHSKIFHLHLRICHFYPKRPTLHYTLYILGMCHPWDRTRALNVASAMQVVHMVHVRTWAQKTLIEKCAVLYIHQLPFSPTEMNFLCQHLQSDHFHFHFYCSSEASP